MHFHCHLPVLITWCKGSFESDQSVYMFICSTSASIYINKNLCKIKICIFIDIARLIFIDNTIKFL